MSNVKILSMKKPNFAKEKKLWKAGAKIVVGLDEAGRGCGAGPVVAAAVSISPDFELKISGLRDSKKLSPRQRERIFNLAKKSKKIKWAIGKASPKEIDRLNILEATKLAMKRALKNLKSKIKEKTIDFLILDGNFKLDLKIPQISVKKGDEKVFSCALASIFAKVVRDKIMIDFSKKFPEYGFEKNKGYLTKFHLMALKKYGPCKIHRLSFFPIKILEEKKKIC